MIFTCLKECSLFHIINLIFPDGLEISKYFSESFTDIQICRMCLFGTWTFRGKKPHKFLIKRKILIDSVSPADFAFSLLMFTEKNNRSASGSGDPRADSLTNS